MSFGTRGELVDWLVSLGHSDEVTETAIDYVFGPPRPKRKKEKSKRDTGDEYNTDRPYWREEVWPYPRKEVL